MRPAYAGHKRWVQSDTDPHLDDFFQADDGRSGVESVADHPRALPPRLGMLAELSDVEFDHVARSAKLAFVEADHVVFRQGDQADRFFILVDGGVEVVRDGALLATLGPGAFFGESALLVQGLRSATVTTIAESSLWSISYDAFSAAMSHHLLADEVHGAEAERRIAQTPDHAFGDGAGS